MSWNPLEFFFLVEPDEKNSLKENINHQSANIAIEIPIAGFRVQQADLNPDTDDRKEKRVARSNPPP